MFLPWTLKHFIQNKDALKEKRVNTHFAAAVCVGRGTIHHCTIELILIIPLEQGFSTGGKLSLGGKFDLP